MFQLNMISLITFFVTTPIFLYSLFILLRRRPIIIPRKLFTITVFVTFVISTISIVRMNVLDSNIAVIMTKLLVSFSQIGMFSIIMCPAYLLKPNFKRNWAFYISIPFIVMIVLFWTTEPFEAIRSGFDWSIELLNIVSYTYLISIPIVGFTVATLFIYTYKNVPEFRHKIRYIIVGILFVAIFVPTSFFVTASLGGFRTMITSVAAAITVMIFSLAFIDI